MCSRVDASKIDHPIFDDLAITIKMMNSIGSYILELLCRISQCIFVLDLASKPWPDPEHKTGILEALHATCA